jgi:hypothetical protein
LIIMPGRGHLTVLLDAEQLATNLSQWPRLAATTTDAAASRTLDESGGSAVALA